MTAAIGLESEITRVTGLPVYQEQNTASLPLLETLPGKIWRHIKSLELDPSTLLRGVRQIKNGVETRADERGVFGEPEMIMDYQGINGLIKAKYNYRRTKYNDFYDWRYRRKDVSPVEVYLFPEGAKFEVHATSPGESKIKTMTFTKGALETNPQMIASFTGPTFRSGDGLPNNGFYLKDYPGAMPFRETEPPGGRRGAFALSDLGELVIIDDATKWRLIEEGFPRIRALIGGGGYFFDRDSADLEGYHGSISYLFQCRGSNESLRTGFACSYGYQNRAGIAKMLTDFSARIGSQSFIALELEYSGSGCFIRGEDADRRYHGYSDRYDHYFVTL